MNSIDLVIGGLRGYRWWSLDREGWLRSPWRGRQRWLPGTNHAGCLARRRLASWRPSKEPHPRGAPEPTCDCGFYALHTVPTVHDDRVRYGWEVGVTASGDRRLGLVFGVASAHGRVLVGVDGWRAEMARPAALLWGPDIELDQRFEQLQARYGLPIYRALRAIVEEWGPGDVERELASAA